MHRDVKDENIFIETSSLTAILIDFGFSKILTDLNAVTKTKCGTLTTMDIRVEKN